MGDLYGRFVWEDLPRDLSQRFVPEIHPRNFCQRFLRESFISKIMPRRRREVDLEILPDLDAEKLEDGG